MTLWEGIRVALRGLTANKLRAILTMLGIIIGVAAVIALLAIGQGVQASVIAQIQSTGPNLIFVSPGAARQEGGVRAAQGSAVSLTYDDALALNDPVRAPNVVAVAPEFTSFGQIVYRGQNTNTRVAGVTPEYLTVRNYTLANGDFIDKGHIEANSRVAVLGANVATTLFGDADPIGQDILINRSAYRVIGVLAPKGGSGLGSQDEVVLVPLTTAQARLFGGSRGFGVGQRLSTINVSTVNPDTVDAAIAEITDILRERHKLTYQENDFTITSQKDIIGAFTQITTILTVFLGSIAGISLVVGGIGIMNIMLVSVTERTREIGIRKAVGARSQDILIQFLIEAVVLSVLGGLGGIGLGWAVGEVVNTLKLGGTTPITSVMTWDAVALAVGFSVAVGLFFGIYPASRAAALNPIEALRYE